MESRNRPALARKARTRTPITPNRKKAVCRALPSVCRAAGALVAEQAGTPVLCDRQRADLLEENLLRQLDAAGTLGLSCNVLVVGARIQIDFDSEDEHLQINAGLETVQSAIRQLSRQNLVQPIPVPSVEKHRITNKGQSWLKHPHL